MDFSTTKLCALLVIFSLIFLLFSRRKSTNSNPKNLPPGPFPLPIVGNLLTLAIKGNPHKTLTELASVHGPIMTLKLGHLTTIVISSPKVAKLVLQKHDLALSTPFVPDSVRAHQHDQFSVGWLPASSTKWRTLRKVFKSRFFSQQMLEVSREIHLQELAKFMDYVRQCAKCGVALDIRQTMSHTAFSFMFVSIFSMNLSHSSSKEIMNLINCMIKEIGAPNICDFFPILKSIDPQRIRYRLTTLCRELFKVFDEIIEVRLMSRKERSPTSFTTIDFLDILLEEENEGSLTREDVLHLLLDLFGAGVDTTSATLEWAMAELIRKPFILQKAQQEIDQVLGQDKEIQDLDLLKLPYLQAILKETFRLHPPAPLLLPHLVQEDIEVYGLTIPKGAQLLINAWAIGRDPSGWPNTESFLPERFLGSEVDFKGQHFELIPFGAGRRICPGLPLASQTIHLVLGLLIRSFNWVPEGGVLGKDIDMDGECRITLKKVKPLRAIPIDRVDMGSCVMFDQPQYNIM